METTLTNQDEAKPNIADAVVTLDGAIGAARGPELGDSPGGAATKLDAQATYIRHPREMPYAL
jgi:hypothetical protein